MQIKKHSLLTISLFLACLSGCSGNQNHHQVLLLGARSSVPYHDVIIGDDLTSQKKGIAVFGHGELASEKWGELHYRLSNGESGTFESGGLIIWSEPNAEFTKIYGKADVELVGFLFSTIANENLEPSSMRVINKWKIAVGEFNLQLKKGITNR